MGTKVFLIDLSTHFVDKIMALILSKNHADPEIKMAIVDTNDQLPPTFSSRSTRTTATLAIGLMLQ